MRYTVYTMRLTFKKSNLYLKKMILLSHQNNYEMSMKIQAILQKILSNQFEHIFYTIILIVRNYF